MNDRERVQRSEEKPGSALPAVWSSCIEPVRQFSHACLTSCMIYSVTHVGMFVSRMRSSQDHGARKSRANSRELVDADVNDP
jgi:hypothetical protein